ncbi:MAG: hypothetical protein IJA01_04830 [Firmicutes bacterium]|nr:hypothetical protein [Bacillota bacterium]
MKKVISKVLAFIIAFTMVVTLIPALPASAATEFEVSFDGNGGHMTITRDGYTFSGIPDLSEEKGTEGSCFRDLGYTKVTITNAEIYKFLGWYPYVDGKLVEGASLLTTNQMLDYKFPNKSICFYAQWQQIKGGDIDVGISGNGGKFKTIFSGETYTTGEMAYGEAVAGATLRDIGYTYISTPVNPNGNRFMGWCAMRPTDNYLEPWVVVEGTSLLTADEMFDYIIPEEGVFFFAKWAGIPLPGEKSIPYEIDCSSGLMKVTLNGETFETNRISRGDGEIGTTLKRLGYSYISDPVHSDGNKFEGWCAAASLGLNKGWQVIEGAEYLTTEEILNYQFPEKGILFIAQWEGVEIGDLSGGEDLYIDIHGEQGEFFIEPVSNCYETNGITVLECTEGSTLKEKKPYIETPTHPEGYVFLGWRLYERDGFYYNKTDTVLTTEQMMDYKLPPGGLMFVAQWESKENVEQYGGYDYCVDGNGATLTYINVNDQNEDTAFDISGSILSGEKLGDRITICDPIAPKGKTFEGWSVYKQMPEGYRSFKKVANQKLLTTNEMLSYECTDAGLLFLAKWSGENLPEYYGNSDWFAVDIYLAGGTTTVCDKKDGWYTTGTRMSGESGGRIRDVSFSDLTDPVHPKGLKFKGWTLYKQQGEDYAIVKGAENMTTSEVLDYKLTDFNVKFKAQWHCDHSYKTIEMLKATTTRKGYIEQQCKKCDELKRVTLYKADSVKLSTSKYTYDGKAKKPSVTVKDSKGNTISSKYYTVSYAKGRKAVGRYKVTVKFKTRYSGTKTAYFTIVPKAPSSASATLYGYDDVKFSWKKSTGAKGYSVYYKTATGSYKLLTRTTKTSVKKANLSDGIKYTFKVVPYYKSGYTRYDALTSKTASVYTLKKLAAPTVEKYNNSKVRVKWSDIDGQSGYQISKSTSKTKTNIVSTYATTSGQSKVLKATKNKKYYYKVRAYKTVSGKKIYGPWSTPVE